MRTASIRVIRGHIGAGAYALACQVKPEITPDEFWSAALKTGRTIDVPHGGRMLPLGPILDPANLIRTLRSAAPPASDLISATSALE